MKCPKCGYNSFEYYDSCIKCSHDVSSYRLNHGLAPLVLPGGVRSAVADGLKAKLFAAGGGAAGAMGGDDLFPFQLPDQPPAAAASTASYDDPFNFDVPDAPAVPEPLSMAPGFDNVRPGGDDAFADLLDLGSMGGRAASAAAPAAVPEPEVSSSFDLENFSWDDVPDVPAGSAGSTFNDSFDDLFGLENDNKK